MSAHPTLQATLPQALENALLTIEYLRGCAQFASPVESIVLMALLADAVNVAERLEEFTSAVRMEYTEPGTEE